ncbi:hypothetical protein [Flagellimonas sediminis]|uniref:Uncharacterized protein n=1 Tax=Flagellimonas sediminis TaxID=2696468 RepID=A0A6I5KRA0_9FLAO|nr:hypothetical protein [Allomuricauda sediminis]NDV43057.1 hypothetical protein [Allomuricauda sediminis]
MKYLVIFIVLFLLPTFVLSQNEKDVYEAKTEQINPQKIDSLCYEIYSQNNLENLEYSFKYIDDIEKCENVITTNYWANDIKVNFVFENGNLSYLTPSKFDDFRRSFYQEKILNVLVYLNDKEVKRRFFKAKSSKPFTFYKTKNFITTTIFFERFDRFLIFDYYFQNDKLIKVSIRELNPEFQWDKINYTDFYYNNSKIVSRNFYQSLMDGRFSLDRKINDEDLIKISTDLLEKIKTTHNNGYK